MCNLTENCAKKPLHCKNGDFFKPSSFCKGGLNWSKDVWIGMKENLDGVLRDVMFEFAG